MNTSDYTYCQCGCRIYYVNYTSILLTQYNVMFLIGGDEVARMVAEADTLEEVEDSVVDVIPGTGVLVTKPKPPK